MDIEILMDVRTGGRVNNVRPATSYRDHTRASGVKKFTIEFVKNTGVSHGLVHGQNDNPSWNRQLRPI